MKEAAVGRQVRIGGTELRYDTRLCITLRDIKGIGPTLAYKICKDLNFPLSLRVRDLQPSDIERINEYIEKNFITGTALLKLMYANKQREIDLKTYKGYCLSNGYPARGQRNKNNRTAKALNRKGTTADNSSVKTVVNKTKQSKKPQKTKKGEKK